ISKDGLIDHGEGTTARGHGKMKARYSTYQNLMGVCRPIMRKHGFTFNNIIEPTADVATMNVVGYLSHIAGHQMVTHFPLGPGPGRSAAQARGSAASYGKRYNLILLLDIVSEAPQDLDDDARRHTKPRSANDPVKDDPISSGAFPGDELSDDQTTQLGDAMD